REAQPLVAASQFEAAIKILQPAAEATGDASVDHLLRQAVSGQGEMAGRIEAILTRAQALSASNPDEAIQFLSGQSTEIQQQPRVVELRKKLDAIKEQERVGAEQ